MPGSQTKFGAGFTAPTVGVGHSYWQVARLQVMPAFGGVPPQSAGHSHLHVVVLHVSDAEQPPQSGRHSLLQIAGFVLHANPAGGGFGPQSAHSHSQVARLHVEKGPGGEPGQPEHWYWHVFRLHWNPGPGDTPGQPAHSQAQSAWLHVNGAPQPPQSGLHSTVQTDVFVLQNWLFGIWSAATLQSGQSHWQVAWLHSENGPGGLPGHAAHSYWHVDRLHWNPGPGEGPVQPPHSHAQVFELQLNPELQPPQLGRHSTVQDDTLHVCVAPRPPVPQSDGQRHWPSTQTSGA